jgi:hypothetical protein
VTTIRFTYQADRPIKTPAMRYFGRGCAKPKPAQPTRRRRACQTKNAIQRTSAIAEAAIPTRKAPVAIWTP